ncbi:MAG: hypothetical protein RIC55_27030 [Pirellulaceae bacterium]
MNRESNGRLDLERFDAHWAKTILGWICSREELRWWAAREVIGTEEYSPKPAVWLAARQLSI